MEGRKEDGIFCPVYTLITIRSRIVNGTTTWPIARRSSKVMAMEIWDN